jgi:hypothetical protein
MLGKSFSDTRPGLLSALFLGWLDEDKKSCCYNVVSSPEVMNRE